MLMFDGFRDQVISSKKFVKVTSKHRYYTVAFKNLNAVFKGT